MTNTDNDYDDAPKIRQVRLCAASVKSLGDMDVYHGCTLRNFLKLNGVSLWEVVEPIVAAFELPRALESDRSIAERLKYRLRSHVAGVKYLFNRSRETRKVEAPGPTQLPAGAKWDAIFFGFSGYMERDIIRPFFTHLDAENVKYAILSDHGTMNTATVESSGKDRVNIWSLWDKECGNRVSQFQKEYFKLLGIMDREMLVGILATNIPFLSKFNAISFLKYTLESLIPYYFYHLVIAEKLYKDSEVKWNISPDVADPRIRAFCLTARQQGTQWADIQYGIYGREATEWSFCIADYLAVWGDEFARLFREFNVREEIIHITGSPKFDSLLAGKSNCSAADRYRGKKVRVLFCSMYALQAYSNIPKFAQTLRTVKREIIEYASLNPDVELTIKLHPLEDAAFMQSVVSGLDGIKIIGGAADIRELILNCDVFITLGSTATIDALLLSKLVIFPNYEGLVWWDDIYLRSSVVIEARSTFELRELFGNIAEVAMSERYSAVLENRRKFLEDRILFSNDSSARRILKALGLLGV